MHLLTKAEIMSVVSGNQEIIAFGIMYITAYAVIAGGFWLVKVVIGE